MRAFCFALFCCGLLACTADLPNGVIACTRSADCPSGLSCWPDNRCYNSPPIDGGQAEAGSEQEDAAGDQELEGGLDDAPSTAPDAGDATNAAADARDSQVLPSCEVANGGCDKHATCTIVGAAILCTCNAPYWEGDGENGCRDVKECEANAPACASGVNCTENIGAPPGCGCPSGYSGSSPNCVDIDECGNNTDTCNSDQFCSNTTGGFRCTACTPISHCQGGLTCTNASNETCATCGPSYVGDGTSTCAPCANGTWESSNETCIDCGTIANCASVETCDPATGSNDICPTCNAGYSGSGTGACIDINECTANTDNCAATPDACVNTVGTFLCDCPPGYIGNGVGSGGCVSECLTGNGGCDPLTTCTIGDSGVVCGACPAGYTGTGDNACTPRLTGLTADYGSVSPALGSDVTSHSIEVPLVAQSITLTPTAPAGVSISIAGASVTSGTPWQSSKLNLGYNVITVVVSQAGRPSRTYTINVRRGRQEAYIKASNTGGSDSFGWATALSSDGSTLVVTAPNEDSAATGVNGSESNNAASTSGAAYVFVRTGSSWTQQAYLKPSNTSADDYFGWAATISGDGNLIAIGSYGEDTSATDSGAVYVFTRSSGTWMETALLKASNPGTTDTFGTSIAMSTDGNTLAVAAIGEDSNATLVNGDESNNAIMNAGAVYVFIRSGNSWTKQAYIKASNPGAGDLFGEDGIALSGDGNTLAVGAFAEDSGVSGVHALLPANDDNVANSGAVYVYTRVGSSWSHQQSLKGSAVSVNQYFGWDLAMSSNGNTLAVGAYGENDATGAAYIFTRTGSTWSQQARVMASNADLGDQFGYDVDLSANGNALVVGAYDENSDATGIGGSEGSNSADLAGAVYQFMRSGTSWSQQAYLKASNAEMGDRFGAAVSMSGDGQTIVAGAYGEDSNATGINGSQGNDPSYDNSGAVYVFR